MVMVHAKGQIMWSECVENILNHAAVFNAAFNAARKLIDDPTRRSSW